MLKVKTKIKIRKKTAQNGTSVMVIKLEEKGRIATAQESQN